MSSNNTHYLVERLMGDKRTLLNRRRALMQEVSRLDHKIDCKNAAIRQAQAADVVAIQNIYPIDFPEKQT